MHPGVTPEFQLRMALTLVGWPGLADSMNHLPEMLNHWENKLSGDSDTSRLVRRFASFPTKAFYQNQKQDRMTSILLLEVPPHQQQEDKGGELRGHHT